MESTPDVVICILCDRPASVILRRVPACSAHAVRHLTPEHDPHQEAPTSETTATGGPDTWIGANLSVPPEAGSSATTEAAGTTT